MFKRVTFVEWQNVITLVVFFITFAAFVYFSWRAIRMKRKDREHMANLPLEDDQPPPPTRRPDDPPSAP